MAPKYPNDRRQVVADASRGAESLLARMRTAASGLREGESLVEFAGRRNQVVALEVKAMVNAIGSADAFDVIDLMRQREIVAQRMGYQEQKYEATATAVEVVALILLARGGREPAGHVESDEAQRSIEILHDSASRILTAGVFALLAEGDSASDNLSKLVAEYRGAALTIRNRQYSEFHDEVNEALFGAEAGLQLGLGFAYEDFVLVREAIDSLYIEKMGKAMDTIATLSSQWAENKTAPQDEGELEKGRAAVSSVFVTPGDRASFSAAQVADRSGLSIPVVSSVLDLFSVDFKSAEPVEAVISFLEGENPFAEASLVADGSGNYIQLALPIGTDCLRQVVERALKGTAEFQPYNERRKWVSETMAVRYLERLLGVPVAMVDMHYFAPKKNVDPALLGVDCVKPTSVGQDTEADALFVIGDVAVCVEVKGSSFSSPVRKGDTARARRDLNATIGSATSQAHRLEDLIKTNGGLWLADRTWLDLSEVREIRSIAICLDDLGPLGTALDALVRGGIITDDKFPWIVSLSDLSTIAVIVDRPSEFLLYLRRRTEPSTSRRFSAVDELDLFMLFLNGGLYLEPDPTLVHELNPATPPPTTAQIRSYERQATAVRVDVHTDALDAWMESKGHPTDQPKPSFRSASGLLSLVDFLHEGHKPGWLRMGADLLNIASKGQIDFLRNIEAIAAKTRTDGAHHSMSTGFAGAWGFPLVIAYTKERGLSVVEAAAGLESYLVAKKHQMRSDRALGILMDDSGRPIGIRYSNDPPREDADLDSLVAEMRLKPLSVRAPIPPSASRTTKRLKSKRTRRR